MAEETKEKKQNDWVGIVAIVIAILLTGIIVGGLVWYYMNQNEVAQNKSYNDTVTAENGQIAALNNKILSGQNTSPTDNLSTLRTFCEVQNQNIAVANLGYMETVNGVYGNCGVGGEGGGAMMISHFVNGAWSKIWAGNGVIETSTCDQYKIPSKMSGGTCNY